jgi:hypothetical protein
MASFVTFACKLRSPWTVLAVTDGVWKYVGLETILKATPNENGEGLISRLRSLAGLPGSNRLQDDFTVVLLQEGGAD